VREGNARKTQGYGAKRRRGRDLEDMLKGQLDVWVRAKKHGSREGPFSGEEEDVTTEASDERTRDLRKRKGGAQGKGNLSDGQRNLHLIL